MTDGPEQANKDYWKDPKHDRRRVFSRRTDDYLTCPFHQEKCAADQKVNEIVCAKIKDLKTDHDNETREIWAGIGSLRAEIVGRFTFRLVISLLIGINALSSMILGLVLNKIWRDIETLEQAVSQVLSKIQ